MKRFVSITFAFLLIVPIFSFYNLSSAHAKSPSADSSTENSNVVFKHYNSEPTREEIAKDKYIVVDGDTSDSDSSSLGKFHTLIAVPVGNDYGHNWKLIDKYNGNSKTTDTIGEFTKQILAASVPVLRLPVSALYKGIISVMVPAAFNTFHKPPKTVYYTTYHYYDYDYSNVYVKMVLKTYSNSARTHLIKTESYFGMDKRIK
ncbi:hypothetical protein ACFP7A_12940 [Sporolactobacillus kofuensis]|uniref:Uncharacterized protein n=1 Tax=Sporolactobacillus kofuensis TaxID=269672 RepID=A0ABW1WIQ5_9BACL|nr:hypothetical protein [Sporolactobacillus kofuensis]MCO7176955.1 hypothetical protein [Sporolactobacillus kofuensis]